MGSERKGRSTKRAVAARIQTALYTHQRLAFLLSVLLVSLLYYASTDRPSSPYVSKRYGLGAGDNAGELKSALRRKGDGRAAVAIIRVVGMKSKNDPADVQYLVQVKSHDYPIVPFRGSVCLLGGNANKRDTTPLDTLKRELSEELHHPEWIDQIDPANIVDSSDAQLKDGPLNNSSAIPATPGRVRDLGATLHFQSSELIGKPNPYAFICALYEITLTPEDLPPSVLYPRGANLQEGRMVLLTEDQLVRHSTFAWGYEYTVEKYFGKKTVNKQKGTAVSNVEKEAWAETIWTPAK
ncbi:hypothetical protein ACHAXT_002272 [Thalassiosira profunda]